MSIRKRGNKYYFAVTVVDEFGNKKRIERVGGTTKAAARAAARRKNIANAMDRVFDLRQVERQVSHKNAVKP